VLDLGQTVEVKVDDIDPQGKVSLSLAGEAPAASSGGNGSRERSSSPREDRGGREDRGDRGRREDREDRGGRSEAPATSAPSSAASFEDAFQAELVEEFGDLGPEAAAAPSEQSSGGGDRRRGGRRRR